MTTQDFDNIRSFYSEVIRLETQAGPAGGSRADEITLPEPIHPDRRNEKRTDCGYTCTYEMMETLAADSFVIQQGEAVTLNQSAKGILLLMGATPQAGQLLEVHIPHSRWRTTLNLFEVRWVRPIHVESHGHLSVLGCLLTFGPYHYWRL